MAYVSKRDDVISNIKVFEGFLSSKKDAEKDFGLNGVLNTEHMVIYKVNGENHFGPCRFLAFKKNSIEENAKNDEITDKEIANTMKKIVGTPFTNSMTETKYAEYAAKFSQDVPKLPRMFWRIKDERGKNLDLKL